MPTAWRCVVRVAPTGPVAMAARARARWTRPLSWLTWARTVLQVGGWQCAGCTRCYQLLQEGDAAPNAGPSSEYLGFSCLPSWFASLLLSCFSDLQS